jgi:hypothetical protein
MMHRPELRSRPRRPTRRTIAYVLFELSVTEARCNGYGDVVLPSVTRWREAAGP